MHEWFESILVTRWLILFSGMVLLGFMGMLVNDLRKNENPSTLRTPFFIIILGLVLRVVWIYLSQPEPLSDFEVYWHHALAFADGDYTYKELSRHPGVIVLYSWFVQWFGPNLISGWIMNLLFSTMMMILFYAVGREIFGHRAGILSVLLAALCPQSIAYTALVATETPTATCFLMILWAVLYSRRVSTNWFYWIALGVLVYGSILIRSSTLLLLVLMPFIFVLFRRESLILYLKRFFVVALTVVMLLSTWIAHQNIIGGSPKMFWGVELWLSCAIQYERGGRYTHPRDMAFYDKVKPYYEAGTQAGLIKAYEVIGEESIKVIKSDPWKYLWEGQTRMFNILKTSQTGIRWSQKGSTTLTQWPEKYVNKFANVSNIFWHAMLWLFPLGLFAYRKKSAAAHKEGWVFIVSFMAIWFVFHYLVAVASERYSFQILPFVILMASGGLTSLPAYIKGLLAARLPSVMAKCG